MNTAAKVLHLLHSFWEIEFLKQQQQKTGLRSIGFIIQAFSQGQAVMYRSNGAYRLTMFHTGDRMNVLLYF